MFHSHSKSSPLIGAAVGLSAGLLANLVRKAAVQSPTALAKDWVEALAAEHRAALKIFDALEATDDAATGRRAILLTQLKHAIGKHAFQEENSIYPALRDHGLATAEGELSDEHGDVKHYLFRLSEMDKGDAEWLPTLKSLRAAIEPHMKEEEEEIFPQLRAKLSAEENHALAKAMNREGFKLA